MSTNPSTVLRSPHTVAVAPTETTLESFTRTQLQTAKRITVQVYNADGAQTFAGIIYRKQTGMSGYAVYDDVTFAAVTFGTSKDLVVDVEGTDVCELRGTMSGAGGNVQSGVIRISNSP